MPLYDPLADLPDRIAAWARCTIEAAESCGIPVTVTSGHRTCQEQARLRARWESGGSPYPANKPGESAHNYGLAWDSTVPEALMPEWRRIRLNAGWHVPPNDLIHAEVPGWRNLVVAGQCGVLLPGLVPPGVASP